MNSATVPRVLDSGQEHTVPQPRHMQSLWSVQDAAAFLGLPVKTPYQWRYLETGPPSHRIGRHIRYDPAEVHSWVLQQP
ncbi:putative DNA-binding transcriptional regulator AlpA [Spinactinospora alkalitolerans]|uniref:Putative DNA-binding transcriptional regulator AlpA n=1 Tax=Spinactinospora alkalitolerans TaxID=687207 RepID=A0A852U3M7_9ACTN|nr:helix-turn-helix domain-containing protein [Spinactinospora alkalitolerans]NYE50791.1 putative DNA-binding transcriptional regulator AlpA [Spinactinospora alkalitolerans]